MDIKRKEKNKTREEKKKCIFNVPAASSVLQAAGGDTEHAALVVKCLPRQIDAAGGFTDREQSGNESDAGKRKLNCEKRFLKLRQQDQKRKHFQPH